LKACNKLLELSSQRIIDSDFFDFTLADNTEILTADGILQGQTAIRLAAKYYQPVTFATIQVTALDRLQNLQAVVGTTVGNLCKKPGFFTKTGLGQRAQGLLQSVVGKGCVGTKQGQQHQHYFIEVTHNSVRKNPGPKARVLCQAKNYRLLVIFRHG